MGKKGSRLKVCRRGHPLTPATYYEKESKQGYVLRNCRRCRSISERLRYRNSVELQESTKKKCRRYYTEVQKPKRERKRKRKPLRLGTPVPQDSP